MSQTTLNPLLNENDTLKTNCTLGKIACHQFMDLFSVPNEIGIPEKNEIICNQPGLTPL